MQKVRRHPYGLRPLVSMWFQVLLTQLTAVLFAFQSPYYFTIGHRVVFSLARWSAQLHTEFHELRITLVHLSTPIHPYAYGAITRYGRPFQGRSARTNSAQGARNPGTNPVLGCSDFARRYLRNRCLFLLLQVLRCFSSLRSLSLAIHSPVSHPKVGFPHSEIVGSSLICQLLHAFRRLSRPSSPLDAKASTRYP